MIKRNGEPLLSEFAPAMLPAFGVVSRPQQNHTALFM